MILYGYLTQIKKIRCKLHKAAYDAAIGLQELEELAAYYYL